jgi:molecular chaperone DnaK
MGIDPMECVASGAAIQAGVLAGESGLGEIVLVDVTPLTLGVETLGGVATPLIARNTPIPVKQTETFTTAADMQTSVTIHVFQGERPMASDNVSLGEFNLDGFPPAPRGVPKIEVTFDIDASGILNVTARDTATGKSQSIRISGSTRLNDADKQRMIKDAEQYAEADKKRREDADKLNEADSVCYQAEKMLADFADKLTDELKGKIQAAMQDTKQALARKDAAAAAEKAEALRKLLKEAGTVIYAQTPGAGPYAETKYPGGNPPPYESSGEARPSGSGPRGKVVDAEYKEEK